MAIAASKGPVDAVEEALSGAVGLAGVSEVRRLTRFAEDAPRREGALTEDWVWEPAINLSDRQGTNDFSEYGLEAWLQNESYR